MPTGQPSVSPSVSPSSRPSQYCEQNFFQNRLVETGTDLSLDIDGSGANSAGDITVFDSNTIQRAFMEPGFVSGWCKSLRGDDKSYCAMTFDLPEGTLFTQGLFTSMSILAGTECYADQELAGAVSGSNERSKRSFTFEEVGFLPNLSCNDIYGEAWTATGFDDFVDADLSGDISPGDSYLLYDSVFENPELSRRTGGLTGECTILQDGSFDKRYCFLTAFFEGGSLSFQGSFHSMLITGGTGCFAKSYGMLSGSPDVSTLNTVSYKFLSFDQPSEFCKKNRFRDIWIETGSDVFIDRNKDGRDSPGDAYVFNHVVKTTGNGRAGSASGYCIYLENILLDTYCTINFDFEEGSIAVQGFFHKLAIGTHERNLYSLFAILLKRHILTSLFIVYQLDRLDALLERVVLLPDVLALDVSNTTLTKHLCTVGVTKTWTTVLQKLEILLPKHAFRAMCPIWLVLGSDVTGVQR